MIDIIVKIENTYPDTTIVKEYEIKVPAAPLNDDDALTEWFEEYIYEHTGTGPSRADDPAYYEATIIKADEQPALVGETYEWGG